MPEIEIAQNLSAFSADQKLSDPYAGVVKAMREAEDRLADGMAAPRKKASLQVLGLPYEGMTMEEARAKVEQFRRNNPQIAFLWSGEPK